MRPDPPRRSHAEAPPDEGPSTSDLAGSYRPRRLRDFLFLHGLALAAARRTIRQEPPLHVPSEWEAPRDDSEERFP